MQIDSNLIIAVALGLAAFMAMRYMPRILAGVPFVAPSELKQKLDAGEDVLVVDVRTESEFVSDTGHVPGALNLPLGDVAVKVRDLGEALKEHADTPVYIMCRTTNRAPHAARSLRKAGLTNLRVVDGGVSRWRAEGYPTVRN